MPRHIERIYGSDFETLVADTIAFKKTGITRVIHASLIDYDDYRNIQTFLNISDWLVAVKNLPHSTIIYFHNGSGFDFTYIFAHLRDIGVPLYNKNDLIAKREGFSAFMCGNDIYDIKYQYKVKVDKKFVYRIVNFRCSKLLLSASIEDLGRDLGMPKKTATQNADTNFYVREPVDGKRDLSPRRLEYIEYMVSDTLIMLKALKLFDKNIQNLVIIANETKHPMTTELKIVMQKNLTSGAISLKFQEHYAKSFSFKTYGDLRIYGGMRSARESRDIGSELYYGGWTQFNPKYRGIDVYTKNHGDTDNKLGVIADINSAYPSAMVQEMPWGEIYNLRETPFPKDGKYLIYYKIKVARASVLHGDVVNLLNWQKRAAQRKANNKKDALRAAGASGKKSSIIKANLIKQYSNFRYERTLKNFVAYYSQAEWTSLQNYYDFRGAKIIETYWSYSDTYLKAYTETLYRLKSKYVAEGKKSVALTYKILLNAGYGKHATREVYENMHFVRNQGEVDMLVNRGILEILTKGKLKRYYVREAPQIPYLSGTLYTTYAILIEEIGKKKFSNILIAAEIASVVRVKLWDFITDLGPKYFAYSDTDSVFSLVPMSDKMLAKYFHPTTLGKWSIDAEFDNIIIAASKRYSLYKGDKPVKGAYAGISREHARTLPKDAFLGNNREILLGAMLRPVRNKGGKILIRKDYRPSGKGTL